MAEKEFYGAKPDTRQMNVLLMFFGIHPWSYVNKKPEELLAYVQKEEQSYYS